MPFRNELATEPRPGWFVNRSMMMLSCFLPLAHAKAAHLQVRGEADTAHVRFGAGFGALACFLIAPADTYLDYGGEAG
jgi:hypothetical protein